MKVSARCDYACRALLELAYHWPNKKPLQTHVISARQNIPERYLVQILNQLRRVGLVKSIRGKEGGYTLQETPEDILIGTIISLMDDSITQTHSKGDEEGPFEFVWNVANDVLTQYLNSLTLKDVADRSKETNEARLYQI